MITIRLKDGKELHFENEVTLFEASKTIVLLKMYW